MSDFSFACTCAVTSGGLEKTEIQVEAEVIPTLAVRVGIQDTAPDDSTPRPDPP